MTTSKLMRVPPLVSLPRSSLPMSASDRRPWQGAPTQAYREYSEEAQRRQGRRGPATLVANFRLGTLDADHAEPEPLGQRAQLLVARARQHLTLLALAAAGAALDGLTLC